MDPVERYQMVIDEMMGEVTKQVAPGIYDTAKTTTHRTIVVDELTPGHDYGPDMFVGDINSPEAIAFFRRIDGGPEDVSHVDVANSLGRVFSESYEPPEPDYETGHRARVKGTLRELTIDEFATERDGETAPVTGILLSVGDVFRGPDNNHWQPVHGYARTEERLTELYWISGKAPCVVDGSCRFAEFRGHLVMYVAGPRWPR